MLFIEFLFALVISLLITAIFAIILRRRGAWPFLLLFFIILLGTWAGGIWITPSGPTLLNVYWLPFLIAGLVFALLLTLVILPQKYRIKIMQPRRLVEMKEENQIELVLGSIFWVLILILIVSIFIRYIII
jgi:hypothetical protein